MYRHEVTLTPLSWKWKALIAVFFVIVGGFLLSLFVNVADHHDYRTAECRSGDYLVTANLIGTYARLGNDRRAPYYLRARIFPLRQQSPSAITVSALRLTADGNSVEIPDRAVSHTDGVGVDLGSRIVLARELDIDFVGYSLSGNIRDTKSGAEGNFNCRMRTHRNLEPYIPLLEMMLSV